jgi:hypothetical protein
MVAMGKDHPDAVASARERRARLLAATSHIQGLQQLRVVAGKSVVDTYGVTLQTYQNATPEEQRVLAGGSPDFRLLDTPTGPAFRAVIPFVAQSNGALNCLACHAAREGEVLGAITLEFSIAQEERLVHNTQIAVTATVALFCVLAIVVFARLMRPVQTTAQDIQRAVAKAKAWYARPPGTSWA